MNWSSRTDRKAVSLHVARLAQSTIQRKGEDLMLNGGEIAPAPLLGSSGARILTTPVHEMQRRGIAMAVERGG
jgi:acetyl-CoA acetyltransferase